MYVRYMYFCVCEYTNRLSNTNTHTRKHAYMYAHSSHTHTHTRSSVHMNTHKHAGFHADMRIRCNGAETHINKHTLTFTPRLSCRHARPVH